MMIRVGAIVAWCIALAVWVRYWELTQQAPALLVWTLIGTAGYLATARALHGGLSAQRPVLQRAAIWVACIVMALAVVSLKPWVTIAGHPVRTTVFKNVVDTVFPLWIGASALALPWSGLARAGALLLTPTVPLVAFWAVSIRMPGTTFHGTLPPLSAADTELASRLESHVRLLAETIGVRSDEVPAAVSHAADSIAARLEAMGLTVTRRSFAYSDRTYDNLEIEWRGTTRPEDIVLVGAHYDTAERAPGADDNASGTAGLLEIARHLATAPLPSRTVRAVFFASEEPPFFATEWMGSAVYAREAAARGDRIVAVVSLETIGYYDTTAGSQAYPPPFSLFYPDRGDFIGFVGNTASGPLVRRAITSFRHAARFPSEGVAAPAVIPGIGWSDHMPFWEYGYRAIMITDTAPFRNPHYHQPSDLPEQLDFDRMARVVRGITAVVDHLATDS